MMGETEQKLSELMSEVATKMGWENWVLIGCYRKPDDNMGFNIKGQNITKEMMQNTADKFNDAWSSMTHEKKGSLGFRGMIVEK
jgi:hypothetical protein